MKCSACGCDLPKGAKHCIECGEKISAAEKPVSEIPELKYHISIPRIVISIFLVVALVVTGYFIVHVNRNVCGSWTYTDTKGVFTQEQSVEKSESGFKKQSGSDGKSDKVSEKNESGKNESDEPKPSVKDRIRITIREDKHLELQVNKELIGETEYTLNKDKIIGADGKTNLEVDWDLFSMSIKGKLFGRDKIRFESMDRKETGSDALYNVSLIVTFFVLLLVLLFVAAPKIVRKTKKMSAETETASVTHERDVVEGTARKSDGISGRSSFASGMTHSVAEGTAGKTSTVKESVTVKPGTKSFEEYFKGSDTARSGGLKIKLSGTSGDTAFGIEKESTPKENPFSFGGSLDGGDFEMPLDKVKAETKKEPPVTLYVDEKRAFSERAMSEKKESESWFNSAGDL